MLPIKERAREKKKFIIDVKNYKIIKQIKSGGFGTVYLIENISTKERSVAKTIITPEDTSKYKKMVNLEIGIMIRCEHPTIIKFFGYSFKDFFDQKNITIFMKYTEKGSLADILKKVRQSLADSNYDNTTRQIILIGVARAMKYIHENDVIHRDLKPDNVLIDENYHPKVTDFGLSKFSQTVFSTSQSMQCGTNIYMAPEMIEGKRCSGKVDVYSFAILMYEVVTDSIPYPLFSEGKMTLNTFYEKVVNENYRPAFKDYVKKPIRKLIERCWSKDPSERPTFDEIFKKLAYNIKDSIYDIYDENEEEEEDLYEYYLDNVDEGEIFSYLEDIEDENKPHDAIEKVNEKLKQIENQINSLNEENAVIKNENEKMKKTIKNCQKQNDKLKNENKELNELIERCQNTNDDLKNENEEMKKAIKNFQKVSNKLKDENKELKELIENCQNTNDELKNENAEIKEVMEICLNEKEELRQQISKLQKKSVEINKISKSDSSDIGELKEAIINEAIQIEQFNSQSLHQQRTIINNLISKSKAIFVNPFFIQVKSFYDLIVKLNANDIPRGLRFFQLSNGENQIQIQSNITEILFRINALNSPQFYDFLKKFHNISIEIEFPSDWYVNALDIIRNNFKNANENIKIAAFFSKNYKIREFQNSYLIDLT